MLSTTSGKDRLMLVGVSAPLAINNDFLKVVSSLTYNGVGLSYVGSETQSDDARVELWMLTAPPTGTHYVVVTFNDSPYRHAVVCTITFTGAVNPRT